MPRENKNTKRFGADVGRENDRDEQRTRVR
jgi:hypothetical protein